MIKRCAYTGCRQLFEARRHARFCSDAHRAAAFKQAHSEAAERVPAVHHGGLQISYRKAVEAVARELMVRGVGDSRDGYRRDAANILRPLLSDLQRQRLQA